MKKIAIFGAGRMGRAVKKLIELKLFDYEVTCFCDNNLSLHGKIIDKITVISANELFQRVKDKTIDLVLVSMKNEHLKGVAYQLKALDIENVYITPYYCLDVPLDEIKESDIMIKIDVRKPRFAVLAFYVCDHCNLNCKGCAHFCDLCTEPKFADVDAFKLDIAHLKELFWGVQTFILFGGEPLLNNMLHEFVLITRETFPDADIQIWTNGILLPESPPELFVMAKKCHALFYITIYPPAFNMREDMLIPIYVYKNRYFFDDTKNTFVRHFTLEPNNDPEVIRKYCGATKCHVLGNGVISMCALPHRMSIFNEHFEQNIASGGGFELAKETCGWQLESKLSSPVNTCKYCTFPQEFLWDFSSKKMEDYLCR